MDKDILELLGGNVLTEDVKTALQEAWNKKVDEVREETTLKLKEEYASRFKHERSMMAEAADKFLSEQLHKEIEELVEDKKALAHQRAELGKTIHEAKAEYTKRISQHTAMIESFVKAQLAKELTELNHDHKGLIADRAEASKSIEEARQQMKKEFDDRLGMLESFVIRNLEKEVTELHEDRKQLQSTRVELIRESKAKIEEARKAFVKRSSTIVESAINDYLVKEMTQLKEDITISSNNHFGRKIFEAFAAEYMTSHLSEGSQVKVLTQKLEESKKEMEALSKKNIDSTKLVESSNRKVKLAEEESLRVKTLNSLLNTLTGDKREIMEGLLRTVKTEKLNESFKKYLPSIVSGSTTNLKVDVTKRQNLAENSTKTTLKTGNKVNNIIEEAEEAEKAETNDVLRLKRLAGLTN